MRITSFFTTTVVNNGPVEGFANQVLFAPLHYLLGPRATKTVEVDLTRNRVKPIDKEGESCQSLPGKALLGSLSVVLVIPATLVGAIIKRVAQLNHTIAFKNEKAEAWSRPVHEILQTPSQHAAIHSALTSDLFNSCLAPFLLAKEMAQVSCVSKACFKAVHKEAPWKRLSKESYALVRVPYSPKEEFQYNYSLIKREYDPRVIDLFSSIDSIINLPMRRPDENAYLYQYVSRTDWRYGVVAWSRLSPHRLSGCSVIKGMTRTNGHFILICFHKKSDIFQQEYVIVLYQDHIKKWLNHIRCSSILHYTSDEFLTNPAAHQWLKKLIAGEPCPPPPVPNYLAPLATYQLSY